MEIIRPSPPKTYRTLRRKPAAQPKSYRVVAEEVDGQKFQRVELAFRWMPCQHRRRSASAMARLTARHGWKGLLLIVLHWLQTVTQPERIWPASAPSRSGQSCSRMVPSLS